MTSRRCPVADGDGAGEDAVEAEDRMQHRRLAGTVRADQAQRLPAPDPQVDAVQDLHLTVAGDADRRWPDRLARRPAGRDRDVDGLGDRSDLPRDFVDGDHSVDAALVVAVASRHAARGCRRATPAISALPDRRR